MMVAILLVLELMGSVSGKPAGVGTSGLLVLVVILLVLVRPGCGCCYYCWDWYWRGVFDDGTR